MLKIVNTQATGGENQKSNIFNIETPCRGKIPVCNPLPHLDTLIRKVNPEFNYKAFQEESLSAAFDEYGRVVLVLHPLRGRMLLSILSSLSKIRKRGRDRRSVRKTLSILAAGVSTVFLACFATIFFPKLLSVVSFYVLKKPMCTISPSDAGYRLVFTRE